MAVEPDARRRAHEWEEEVYSAQPEREALHTTISGQEVKPLYTEDDLSGWDADESLGYPGEPPFTRGVYPSMYRGRLWTMRQFAGFGTAEETNERFHYLLGHGQTGLSTAFAGRRIVVGVNAHQQDDEEPIEILRIDPALERKQIGRLAAVRARRDGDAVEASLATLRAAAATRMNLIPPLIECARSHAAEGEIVHALQQVWGDYTEVPVF